MAQTVKSNSDAKLAGPAGAVAQRGSKAEENTHQLAAKIFSGVLIVGSATVLAAKITGMIQSRAAYGAILPIALGVLGLYYINEDEQQEADQRTSQEDLKSANQSDQSSQPEGFSDLGGDASASGIDESFPREADKERWRTADENSFDNRSVGSGEEGAFPQPFPDLEDGQYQATSDINENFTLSEDFLGPDSSGFRIKKAADKEERWRTADDFLIPHQ